MMNHPQITPRTFPKRSIVSLCLASALFLGCAKETTTYSMSGGGPKLPRAQAERALRNSILADGRSYGFDGPIKVREGYLPAYPPELRAAGIEGIVRIRFTMERDGTVSNPSIVGAPPPALAALWLNSFLYWKFEPLRRNGEVVRARLEMPLTFKLALREPRPRG